MGIDTERIASLRSYEDRGLAIRETLVQPRVGGASTVGVLSTPLEGTPAGGWVICHSFGLEQVYLQSLESTVARRLAAVGFAVLRSHAQGYGDSELGAEHATPGSQVRDAQDAAAALVEAVGVTRVGFAGMRFGGSIAALAADAFGAAGLVAVAPVVTGGGSIQAMARQAQMAELSSGRDAGESPLDEFRSTGVLDLLGFPISREAFEEVSALDLVKQLERFRGDSLLVQVSRAPTPENAMAGLAEHLRGLGGTCDVEVLADRAALRFGLPRYRRSEHGRKEDTQAGLSESIAAVVSAWCRDRQWQQAEVRS